MYIDAITIITNILQETTGRDDIVLIHGGDHADLASTVAFAIGKEEKTSPAQVALRIADQIRDAVREKANATTEVTGPYINFIFNQKYLASVLAAAVQDEYGKCQNKAGTVVLEHTSANPNGPLHVGHIRNTIIGDTLARCFRKAGYNLEVQYYVNDMGRQIAIVAWGVEEQKTNIHTDRKGDHLIADVYIKANKDLEADPSKNAAIDLLMQQVEAGDQKTVTRFREPVKRCLDGFKETLAGLNAHHDRFVYESDFVKNGDTNRILARISWLPQAKTTDILSVDLTSFGFEKEYVLRRSDGTSVYAARDLAYHTWKGRNFGRVIDVLGADHKLIGTQLQATLHLLGEQKPDIIFFEFVSLPEGSMSTRKGKFVPADDLLSEARERALIEVTTRRPELDEAVRNSIATSVSVAAIRYDIIKTIPEKSTVFNWEEALDFEKQSGPYIQYAHARACSILDKAGDFNHAAEIKTETEITLLKHIGRFPFIIEEIVQELKPHLLALYARELADLFNSFYHADPVLKSQGITRDSRLSLVKATQNTLKEALETLGIDAIRSM